MIKVSCNLYQMILISSLFFSGCASMVLEDRSFKRFFVQEYLTDIEHPEGLAINRLGDLYTTSTSEGGSIWKIPSQGFKALVVKNLENPDSLLFDQEDNLYVSIEIPEGSVIRFGVNGKRETIVKGPAEPEGLVFDKEGRLFIAEGYPHGIIYVLDKGKLLVLEKGLSKPENLAMDSEGYLYVTETAIHQITKIFPNHTKKKLNRMRLNKPDGLTFSTVYEGFFVAENIKEGRVCYVSLEGKMSCFLKNLRFPQGLICDASGNLYIAEGGKDRILRVPRKILMTYLERRTGRSLSSKM